MHGRQIHTVKDRDNLTHVRGDGVRHGVTLRFTVPRFRWPDGHLAELYVWREFWRIINRYERLILLRLPKRIAKPLYKLRPKRRQHPVLTRLAWGGMAALMLSTVFIETLNMRGQQISYALSDAARTLVPTSSAVRAASLKYDAKTGVYEYNKDYQPGTNAAGTAPGPKFTASVARDLSSHGLKVTDPVNNVWLKMTPTFSVRPAEQQQNQLIYPVVGQDAQKVYTFGAGAVKEDIILNSAPGDSAEYTYKFTLSPGTEARLEKNGDIAIYGANAALLGDVSTATEKDARLLEKARSNSRKTNLLFNLPKPVVLEYGKKVSQVKAWFSMRGDEITIHARGLEKASYPLTIDPTVYIETAQKLMLGNNETNTDFDVTNELIQKSQTTGARIDAWSSTSNLSNAVWGQGTAVAGGYIYSAGGVDSGGSGTASFTSAGTSSFTVPAGVSLITVKVWGAGGAGGSGSGNRRGGNGGGGGYAKAVISVTPSETLTVDVGSGGSKPTVNTNSGSGGGYSALRRGSTFLLQAGGGGGGGGTRGNTTGGAGAPGVALSGANGSAGSGTGPGGGGNSGNTTTSTAGTGGAAGTGGVAGASGALNAGGNGAGFGASCTTAVSSQGGNGGTGGGGGDSNNYANCPGGGGGGGGRYGGGGGGGSSGTNNRAGGGGGGGSSFINSTGLVAGTEVLTAGTGTTPGNTGDSDRANLADGGAGSTTAAGTAAGENGVVVISYVTPGTLSSTVAWAHFNPTTRAIESPNPGNGACSGWCNSTVYNLPVALRNLSLVAYNGFLYAIGGSNAAGTPQTSVYIAKIGANGEPQLWHPTDTNKNNWVYWYSDTALSNARSMMGAVAYNNRLYILGGLTASNTVLGSNTVEYANIQPNGKLSAWTASGMQALTTARYGLTAQVYNDNLYVIGGNATFSGTPISTVEYARLNTDGTMNSWKTTSSLTTSGRMTMGGSFSTIWGAYIYVAGGCTAVNASGYCTSFASDVQLASINADGSLDQFNTILNLSNSRIGHTLITWQGGLYRLGGCRAQDTTSGECSDAVLDVDYGVINQEGEASTVANSLSSGNAPCSGVNPYGCDLPGTSIGGNVLSGSAIMNGYLYIWGGCNNTNSGCGSVSRSVMYTSIGSDGSLTKPSSCGSWSSVDSYCYNTSSLPGSVGAPGAAVAAGRIYSIGGFTASGMVGSIYYATPNPSDGSIASWSTVSLTGIGATSVSYPYTFARANPTQASTVPYNLFILGGCIGATGIGCPSSGGYTPRVYKCNLAVTGAPSGCSMTNQLQIGTVPGATAAGLGAMAGTVYANYIYLMGGLAQGATDLTTTRYAKIDDNNNIVAVSGNEWIESANETFYGRRRGSGFGYNGYLYVVGGYDGSTGGGGVLADIEFAKINVSDGSIGPWKVSSVNIDQRWGLSMTVSNSYAYVIGGCVNGNAPTCNAGGQTNSIQTFQIYNNNSGAVAQYNSGASPGVDRIGGSSVVAGGYIYYAGGCVDIACSSTSNATYYAQLDKYGDFASGWNTGGTLPAGVAWGKLLQTGGTLYYVGGQSGAAATTAQSAVYYTTGITAGNPTWAATGVGITNSGGTAQPRTQFGAATWNGRLYVVGGYNSAGAVQSSVLVSPQLATGGNISSNWSSGSTSFNVARAGLSALAYANNLYLLGGNDGTNYLSDVQFSQINSNTGNAGGWGYSTSLPGAQSDGDAFAANGYIYVVGGRSSAATCRPVTLFAPISANTTIASGNDPTGVGAWSETNQKYTGSRYGAAATYSNGRVYILGGGCGSIVASGDRSYYATLKSQPQVAKYSRFIDADSDVFPNGFLMNGLDNSIGARWQTRYRSSTAASASWGVDTAVGDTTLGSVYPYTPKDGTGTNTSFARYYFIHVSIDASQTFGYPEDVLRGPTIADISLLYTADPSKRMIHGKTFTQGLQQPLDTPCRRGAAVPGDANYYCPLP